MTPTGFLPEDDQGALFVVVQLPGGASVARTSDVDPPGRGRSCARRRRSRTITSVIGLNFIDNYSQSNAAFMVVTLKPFEERKDRSLGAPAVMARLGAKFRADPGRNRGPAVAAADPRPRHRRRLHLCAAGPARRRPQGAGAGAARPHRRRQPGPATDARVQHLLGDEPVDLSRYRSRQGADPRRPAERRLPGAAGVARRLLRQRHEPVRPHLAGPGPGRGRRPVERSTTSTASMCATPKAR